MSAGIRRVNEFLVFVLLFYVLRLLGNSLLLSELSQFCRIDRLVL